MIHFEKSGIYKDKIRVIYFREKGYDMIQCVRSCLLMVMRLSRLNRYVLRVIVMVFSIVFLGLNTIGYAKTVKYAFDIAYKTVNFTGKNVQAITIEGSIPAPTITATLGDLLEVTFYNKTNVETSMHWHGVLLPNAKDNAPSLNTILIKPYTSFTYRIPIQQTGTYWYHAHTGLQAQRGSYGALIFYPKDNKKSDKEHIILLSDWSNEKPKQILAHLKQDRDYYAFKKKAVQSWDKVIQHGIPAIQKRIKRAWTRIDPIQISDVGYDAFLINGATTTLISAVKTGDVLLLRIINASASSYFDIKFSGGPMTVVAADGIAIEPIKIQRLRMAIAETYDILITIPEEHHAYELRATAEDGTGYSSTIFGEGPLIQASSNSNVFGENHNQHKMREHELYDNVHHTKKEQEIKHIQNPDNTVLHDYTALRAIEKTTLPYTNSSRHVLCLAENKGRYTWSFNHKTLTESDKITVKKGENVQFVLDNTTMMHHTLHLQGHFFRVLNGQGDYSPWKHTVNVPAMTQITIECLANEDKDWVFLCHNLYHREEARVIVYEGSFPNSKRDALQNKAKKKNSWFYHALISVQTNIIDRIVSLSNSRNTLELDYVYNYDDAYDIQAIYKRIVSSFLDLYMGYHLERISKNDTNTGIIGMTYLLPLMIESDLQVSMDGTVELTFSSQLQLTRRIAFLWEYNTENDYRYTLQYTLTKSLYLTSNYDSQFDIGVGLLVRL